MRSSYCILEGFIDEQPEFRRERSLWGEGRALVFRGTKSLQALGGCERRRGDPDGAPGPCLEPRSPSGTADRRSLLAPSPPAVTRTHAPDHTTGTQASESASQGRSSTSWAHSLSPVASAPASPGRDAPSAHTPGGGPGTGHRAAPPLPAGPARDPERVLGAANSPEPAPPWGWEEPWAERRAGWTRDPSPSPPPASPTLPPLPSSSWGPPYPP